jgi:hypothetical protein
MIEKFSFLPSQKKTGIRYRGGFTGFFRCFFYEFDPGRQANRQLDRQVTLIFRQVRQVAWKNRQAARDK